MTAPVIEYTRQVDLLDPVVARKAKVSVFGCGTVGSNAANEAARLGIGSFDLYDFDVVEAHNIPSQRFDTTHLGSNKAQMVGEQLVHLSNSPTIRVFNKKVEGPAIVDGIAVMAVDTMDSRSVIYNKVLKAAASVPFIMDFRMSGNLLQCFAFSPGDDRYETTLFDDKDADPVPCGGRTVSYTGALSGCIAANYIRKFLSGGMVPFSTSIDLENMGMLVSTEDN